MAGPRTMFHRRGPLFGTVYKPNSVPLGGAATIYLGATLPSPSSNLPGACVPPFPKAFQPFVLRTVPTFLSESAARAAPLAPYLVLHPVGFSMPSPSPATRCALTAPFHPCLIPDRSGPSAVSSLWHFPAPGNPNRSLTVAAPIDGWVAVSHHRTLWCSDFPPGFHRAIA